MNLQAVQPDFVSCDHRMRTFIIVFTLLVNSSFAQKANIDSIWTLLKNTDGCLAGGQDIYKGQWLREGNVMATAEPWKNFFSLPKDQTVPFLISQISDHSETNVHTCPCMPTKAGELAVYGLQVIFLKNWYELEGFTSYGTKERSGCSEHPQAWLWSIMRNRKQTLILQEAWLMEYERHK